VDLQRLSKGDRVVGISGVLLLLFSFLDWLGLEATGPADGPLGVPVTSGVAKSAWAFPVTLAAVVIGVAMTAIIVAKLFGADLPRPGPLSWGQVFLLLGAIAFLLVAIKLAAGPHEWAFRGPAVPVDSIERLCRTRPDCGNFTTTREVGIILGVLAAGGLLIGGYLRNQEDTAPAPSPKARATA
jgi:hypothetical protein